MKRILLCLIFSIPLLALGQNWAPVNPKWSPQFSLNGEGDIDFSIKIDSAVISGEDTWYYLHPSFLNCDTCNLPVSECTSEYDSLYIKQTPLFGDSILLNENSYTFFGADLVLKPYLSVGQSFDFTLNNGDEITGILAEAGTMQVFGELDSIKTYTYSNDKQLILSKNYGIISFTPEAGNTQLLSGIPELQLGNYVPGIREFYDFEIGDVFVFAGGSYSSQVTYAWLSRLEITEIMQFSDSIRITYSSASKHTTWMFSPTTNNYYSENNVRTIHYNNHSLQGLIPGMVSYELDTINMLPGGTYSEDTGPYSHSYPVMETEYNGRKGFSIGGYTTDFGDYSYAPQVNYVSIAYPPGDFIRIRILNCDGINGFSNYLLSDSLTIRIGGFSDYCDSYSEYVEGLGATCFYSDCGGLVTNQTFMIGYKKGEEEYGNLFTIGEVLDTRELLTEAEVQLFPNPAMSNITVSIPERYPDSFNVSITDISGKRVLNKNVITSNSSIDISKLSPGTYILMGTNDQFTFTQKLVVKSGQ